MHIVDISDWLTSSFKRRAVIKHSSQSNTSNILRTVPPFVTAHTFCASRVSYGRYLLLPRYFCAAYDYVRDSYLSKGCWNPKRKVGLTTHFFSGVLKF